MERVKPSPHHDSLPVTGIVPVNIRNTHPYILPLPSGQSTPEIGRDSAGVAAILDIIRDCYARHEQRLLKTQQQLHRRTKFEPHPLDEAPPTNESPLSTYPTTLGTLSFAELQERTRKYAAFTLHHTYQVNAADIDDGLQAGYLRLWQRLQAQQDLLEGKSLAWICKGIIFTALHATRGDWQFRRRTYKDGERQLEQRSHRVKPKFQAHSREARQAEIRTDVQQAIGSVAEHIMTHEKGKQADYALWSLYGLTMLQVSASELSRLFSVREQSIQQAYQRVRQRLQEALPNYAPSGKTTPTSQRGRDTLPQQDTTAIRKANGEVSNEVYEQIKALIQTVNADTRGQDELALEGIRSGISAQTLGRLHGISASRMQRAYQRVHLMIGAQRDPSVRMRRPEKRVKPVFTLTDATAIAIHQLALELLQQPKSYEKLVALHAHINNLAISTTAKHFNIPTSTLRFYAQKVGTHLGTPTVPARQG